MKKSNGNPVDVLLALRTQLIAAMSGLRRVATPQLGEVAYSSPAEIQSAITFI